MYSCHKDSYLHGSFKQVDAGILCRSVQRAWKEFKHIDEHDLQPPFQRLTSEQPHIPVKQIDPTRRPQGFGRWAMPKLRRELHDKDTRVVLAALTSISDLVHDPEKCYEALKLKVVDRLEDVICHEQPAIRERAAYTLKIIAGQAYGKEAIVRNKALLTNLLDRVEDSYTEIRIHVAACLEMIAGFWKTADVLVEAGAIELLLNNLSDIDEIVEIHLDTLSSLFYCEGKQIALHEDGFQALVGLLDRDKESILSKACNALVQLCTTKEGRQLAKSCKILTVLNRLLHDDRVEVHSAAAQALMFCTVLSLEKIEASKIKGMPKRLVQLCKSRFNPGAQLFAFQALTSICDHHAVRKEVNENYYHDIRAIHTSEDIPEIKNYKNVLIGMLDWVPQSKD